ncbi:hypothetical protein MN546_04315 [Pseudomonas lundensis]|jgi:hypothetical protein|uniref:hypothetical protein n=1 Tax=Pseudomonas TaxID=286 RepID=UPI000A7A776D|nr:hypothetical protein [Pseudomonas lundensis]MCT8951682.1 hypothetical protein [Pseudomonas lundensis]NNA33347.1 hypothetical protein [Pseudomonas lundensis]
MFRRTARPLALLLMLTLSGCVFYPDHGRRHDHRHDSRYDQRYDQQRYDHRYDDGRPGYYRR